MTVTYGTTAQDLLQAVGVELVSGVTVYLKYDGMEFKGPGDTPAFVPMKMSAVKKLASSKIPLQLKMTYQQLFTHAANKCYGGTGALSGSVYDPEHADGPPIHVKISEESLKALGEAKTEAKAKIAKHTSNYLKAKAEAEGKLIGGAAVPLKSAVEMYQPTEGTGEASIYWCVGVSFQGDVRVAARWINDSLSMRVEGNFSNEIKITMDQIGLTSCSAGHWSMHVKIPSDDLVLARKTAASVLMGLGVEWDTKFPDMALIQGKGV